MNPVRRVGVWVAFAVLSPVVVPQSIPAAIAQPATAPAVIEMNCDEEKSNLLEQAFFAVSERVDADLLYERSEQASANWLKLLHLIEEYPDMQLRSIRLAGLIYDEPNTADPSQWHRLLAQVESQHESAPSRLLPALDEAVRITQTFNSGYSSLKARTLTHIASAYRRLGQPDKAVSTLQLAQQALPTMQGAEFKVNALAPMAEVYQQLNQPTTAIALLQQADDLVNEIEPDKTWERNTALSRLAVTYANLQQFDTALAITDRLDETDYLQSSALLAVVRAQIQANQSEAALQAAETIPGADMKAIALNELAQYALAHQQTTEAQQLFEQAIETARPVEDAEYVLSQVVQAYGQWQPDAALPIAQALKEPERRAIALWAIALRASATDQSSLVDTATQGTIDAIQQVYVDWQGQLVYGLVEQAIQADAFELALQLPDAITDPYALYNRADSILKIAEQAGAAQKWEVVERAINLFPETQQDPRSQVLATWAIAYINAGEYNSGIELADRVDPAYPVYRVRVLGAIARQLLLTGNTDPAFAVFDQAKQLTNTITTPAEKIEALNALLINYAQANQPAEAWILQGLETAAAAVGDDSTASAYLRNGLEVLVRDRHLGIALQVAAIMPGESERSVALDSIGRSALQAEDLDVVRQAVELITDPSSQTRLLLGFATYAMIANDPQREAILRQALGTASRIPDPESRVMVFGNEGGTVVEDDSDRASSYEAIALRYVALNQFDEALRVAGLIQDERLRDRLTQRILCFR